MHALKRTSTDQLRQGSKKGRQVLYVWDCAGIDIPQWNRWKQSAGIYFLSRSKDLMKYTFYGEMDFERVDPVSQRAGPRLCSDVPESAKTLSIDFEIYSMAAVSPERKLIHAACYRFVKTRICCVLEDQSWTPFSLRFLPGKIPAVLLLKPCTLCNGYA